MVENNFNPAIKAVVSIRYLALGISKKWSHMKSIGNNIEEELMKVTNLVYQYGHNETKQKWQSEQNSYNYNLSELKRILKNVTSKIKNKNADGLKNSWDEYKKFAQGLENNLLELKKLSKKVVPENETTNLESNWKDIFLNHNKILAEADACSIQLQLIEEYKPEEIDELSDTILKHIPVKYSLKEAEKYNQEYLDAFDAIKKEASKKKNLWDRFLDLLAGGSQQTPAQRVMMQRWVEGEKGDNHNN